jgi:primary-amine oxidase
MSPRRNRRPPGPWVTTVTLAFFSSGWLAAAHPLDPLSKDEIAAALTLLRSQHPLPADAAFPLVALQEPAKADVLAGRPTPRKAFMSVFERGSQQTFEAVVDLTGRQVVSWKEIKGVQPPIMNADFALCQAIVEADAGWRAALRKRGITDLSRVQVDVWGTGYQGEEMTTPRRIVRTVSYYQGGERSASFHPIEGLVAVVDLTAGKVIRLIDTGAVALAKPPVLAATGAAPLAPLEVVQPRGASFQRNGNEIAWDHWRFRFAVHPREGLVLYTVGFLDHGTLRPVLYKASLSDMVVPYGDPGPAWNFRNSFDFSEYSFVGRSIAPLVAGRDVPGNAAFADAAFANDAGRAYDSPHAVAIYERDGGTLWRFLDVTGGTIVSRRARELVLATVVSAPPYEYGFNWVFHQDGRIGMEVLLTGIMTTKGIVPGSAHSAAHGHLIAPDLEAVHHQHFFNFRLDLDVDGTVNSVLEMNTKGLPQDSNNPNGNTIATDESRLTTEQQAMREVNPATNRVWKVINPEHKNALGEPVGYLLAPGENALPFAAPGSWIRRRATFLDWQFWVTPYDALQQYAAGNYVNQSKGEDGLGRWVEANRSVEKQDVVLWYTLGITHIPRPEEWPVMPVHRAGFELVPSGFFRSNPAIDEADIRRAN